MGLGAALTENRRLHLRGERRQCGVPGDGVGGCVGMVVWGSAFPREVESLLLEIWDLGPPPQPQGTLWVPFTCSRPALPGRASLGLGSTRGPGMAPPELCSATAVTLDWAEPWHWEHWGGVGALRALRAEPGAA